MSRRPFHKLFHDDFIMGTVGMTLEEFGAYSRLLLLMYSRGGPIPDEPRWIAGQLNVSARKWGQIREALLSDPKKIILRGEYLSNPRMERELELEEREHQTQAQFGHMGGKARAERAKSAKRAARLEDEPMLPLGAEIEPAAQLTPVQNDLKPCLKPFSTEDNFELADRKSQKTATESQAPLKPARATIFQSPEDIGIPPISSASGEAPRKPQPKAKPKPSRIKAKSARQLPKNWAPKPDESADALTAAWPDKMLYRELERFRDWAKGNGATKKDWDATWRNWIRKADDDWKRAGARQGGKPSAWGYAGARAAGAAR